MHCLSPHYGFGFVCLIVFGFVCVFCLLRFVVVLSLLPWGKMNDVSHGKNRHIESIMLVHIFAGKTATIPHSTISFHLCFQQI